MEKDSVPVRKECSAFLFFILCTLNTAWGDELLSNGGFEWPGGIGDPPSNWCKGVTGPFSGLMSPGRNGDGHAVGAVSEEEGFRFVLWQQFYVVEGAEHEVSVWAECRDVLSDATGVGAARLGYTAEGGTDPDASDVIWTPLETVFPWGRIELDRVTAESSVLTLFLLAEVPAGQAGQRVQFDDASVTGPVSFPPTATPSPGPSITPTPTYPACDRRFAANYGGFDGVDPGDPLLLDTMGIDRDEVHRYGCYGAGGPGPRTQFMVGHLDRYHTAEFQRILTLEDLPDPAGHPDWMRVAAATTNRPGSVYEVANEPDYFLYISPRAYAAWYHAWYERIMALDPTAKMMNGGLTWPIWNERPPDRIAVMAPFTTEIPDTPNGYLETWREEYLRQFGTYPPVDIWNIHVYCNNVAPEIPGSVCGMSLTDQRRQAPRNSIRMVESFRAFMESIGDGDKPLWITEMGILGTLGAVVDNPVRRNPKVGCITSRRRLDTCCGGDTGVPCLTDVEQYYEWDHEVYWIDTFYPWALGNRVVQKNFWFFVGRDTIPWTGAGWSNEIYWLDEEFTRMNPTGNALRRIIAEYRDTSAPSIDSIECGLSEEGVLVTVRAHDTGAGGRLAGISELHYSVGSATGETDIQAWNWIPTIAEEVEVALGPAPPGSHVNIKVADAAGNESEVKSLLLDVLLAPTPTPVVGTRIQGE